MFDISFVDFEPVIAGWKYFYDLQPWGFGYWLTMEVVQFI